MTFKKSIANRKYLPYVFTENGIAMLSSVLKSPKAIQVNIAIMRIFTRLRSFVAMEEGYLAGRVDKLEKENSKTRMMFKIVFKRMDGYEDMVKPKISDERKKIGLK